MSLVAVVLSRSLQNRHANLYFGSKRVLILIHAKRLSHRPRYVADSGATVCDYVISITGHVINFIDISVGPEV